METATIFFLPLEDRPKDFPPLKDFKGKFWHTGIIFNNGVYECFNHERYSKSGLERLKDEEFKNAVFIEANIVPEKVSEEIKGGTDCAEYVARCTGLSKLTGNDKGNLWPEDVYNLINNRKTNG